MGVDIIWLMPIHPIGVKNRKGTLGSYYSVKDYLAVNPEFGTMDDFKSLVKKIHTSGTIGLPRTSLSAAISRAVIRFSLASVLSYQLVS
jgi:hypothetical protein